MDKPRKTEHRHPKACRNLARTYDGDCMNCDMIARLHHCTDDNCSKCNSIQDPDSVDEMAMAINGPHDDSHVSSETLQALRQHRWEHQTSTAEKNELRIQARSALRQAQPEIDVKVLTMRLSGDREEYFVRITCGERIYDVRCYGQDYLNRANYEVDELRHVLLGESRPDLMDPKYADKKEVAKDG